MQACLHAQRAPPRLDKNIFINGATSGVSNRTLPHEPSATTHFYQWGNLWGKKHFATLKKTKRLRFVFFVYICRGRPACLPNNKNATNRANTSVRPYGISIGFYARRWVRPNIISRSNVLNKPAPLKNTTWNSSVFGNSEDMQSEACRYIIS